MFEDIGFIPYANKKLEAYKAAELQALFESCDSEEISKRRYEILRALKLSLRYFKEIEKDYYKEVKSRGR